MKRIPAVILTAASLPESFLEPALAEKYLTLFKDAEELARGWEVLVSLPDAIKANERIQLITGSIALEIEQNANIEQLFEHDFACIREGEILLTDLWFRYTDV